jgi:IMP dehydrogenase
MRFITEPQFDLTYDDVFMAPSSSEISSRMEVDLETQKVFTLLGAKSL